MQKPTDRVCICIQKAGLIYLQLYTLNPKVTVQVNVVDKFLRRSNESPDQFKSPYCTEEELVCS